MIAPKRELKGGLGGGAKPSPDAAESPPASPALEVDQRTAGKDLRLLGAAVRRGWVIPDTMLEQLPRVMLGIAYRGGDERARVNAAKVIVEMYKANDPQPLAEVNVGVAVSVGDTVQGLLNEPGYLDYLRKSGDHGPNGQ